MENESLASEILKDYKKANKRMFVIIIVILTMWFTTIGYLVYLLNDIGTVETTKKIVEQDSETGSNNYVGNDGDIYNGKTSS